VSAWPQGTRDPAHVQILAGLGLRSGMIVPLSVRGRTIGAITLMAAESGRRYTPRDLALAQELARRCAVAIDNGRLLDSARAAQARLTESLAVVDSLFDLAPIGLAHYDRELRYVRINGRLAEINGVPAEQHLGRRTGEILPAMAEMIETALHTVLRTGEAVVFEEMGGDFGPSGRRREFHVSYYPVRRGGEVIGVGTVVFEVTDRRAMERALRSQTDRYETLMLALSEVGEGMVVLEGDHLVYANPAFEQLSGYALDELRALDSIWQLVPDWHRGEARRRARMRAEEGLVDPHYDLLLEHRGGRLVDLEAAAVPLWVDEREQLVAVVRDITARKRAEAEREHAHALERQAREAAEAAERRMGLLAAASELFDETLDEESTLERVARLIVAEVADTCVVALAGRDDDGADPEARQAIAVAREPRREALMAALAPRWPAELGAEETVSRVTTAGHAELVRHFGRTLESFAEDPAHLEQVRGLGLAAVALVPLRARGRIFGALACGFEAAPAPDHEREVLSLLEDLARRAALAMDNARLYAERTHVARTLQRSLLPPALPAIPGVSLAARYRPAGEGTEVGGDFYDCFATSRDEYALLIGDVCGKGAEAAAVTALARYTMRASVLHSESPVRVLSELNAVLLREDLDLRFCTVLYAALAPAPGPGTGWQARVASGGHPLPLLLRADGTVVQPGRSGTVLGIVDDPALEEETVALHPGDSLILYTDGVTEASPIDGRFGLDALAELVGSLHGRSAADIAEAIEARVLAVQSGRPRDDIALVVLQVASAT
jgi:PAS domain S-box-containing protein